MLSFKFIECTRMIRQFCFEDWWLIHSLIVYVVNVVLDYYTVEFLVLWPSFFRCLGPLHSKCYIRCIVSVIIIGVITVVLLSRRCYDRNIVGIMTVVLSMLWPLSFRCFYRALYCRCYERWTVVIWQFYCRCYHRRIVGVIAVVL